MNSYTSPSLALPARAWVLPVLSGVLIGTSYIPFPPWASLFCFVPLWQFWTQSPRLRDVALGGLLTAFVFTLIGFNWVTYLLHEFAHLPWAVAGLGMVAFAGLAHLFVPLAGILWFTGHRRFGWTEPFSLLLLALLTALCEAYSPTIFDWNFGYTWYAAGLPIYHWAEVVGFSGLSAATLLGNLPSLYAWRHRTERKGLWIAAAILVGFAVLNAGGLMLARRLPEPDASLTALLVQGNVGNSEKLAAELGDAFQDQILRRYLDLTERATTGYASGIDFAVWPETAYPAFLGAGIPADTYREQLTKFLAERRLTLITGAYGFDRAARKMTNSLFVVGPDGKVGHPHYSKTILLAFGEYIPGESFFPWIRDWLPPTGEFARGGGPTTLSSPGGYRIGPQICYESLFPAFSRQLANGGAQFIVNATNDSWYGSWQEPHQHLYMTLARGVEFRRPVLRATNTGISTVSLASGAILERSPINQAWTGIYQVPYFKTPPTTFYQRWFYLVPTVLWVSLLVLLVSGSRSTRRSRQTENRDQASRLPT